MTRSGAALVVLAIVASCWARPEPAGPPLRVPGAPGESAPDGDAQGGAAPGAALRPPPRVAGDFLAAWDDDRHAGDRRSQAVYAARVRADGTIVDRSGIAVDTRLQSFPPNARAAATASGWLVAWEHHAARTWDVWARRIDRAGALGPALQVSRTSHTNTDVEVATAGDDALVTWAHVTTTGMTSAMAALIAGDAVTPVPLAPNGGARPAAAFDPASGTFLLAYRDGPSVTCWLVDRRGTPSAAPIQIRAGRPRWDLGPRVAAIGAGEILVTWVEADEQTLHAVRVDVQRGRLVGAPAPVARSASPIYRHALAGGPGGHVLAWVEMPRRGPRELAAQWLDAGTLAARPLDLRAGPGIAGEPKIQRGDRGFLVVWREGAEPRAARIDPRGRVLGSAPLAVRPAAPPAPLPDAQLAAGLDVASSNGADYCAPTRERTVPGTVTGLYVQDGPHPWGPLYLAGLGWGTAAGSTPSYRFHVGRDAPFAPHWLAGPAARRPFQLQVTIPDAGRHRTERHGIDPDTASAARAAGVDGAINLVEFEANGGQGGRGLHFVITRARVIESSKVLAPRLAAARKRFDARVAAERPAIARELAAADRKLRSSITSPILSTLPRGELVIFEPTYRPTTRRIEVLFGYRVTGGYMVDTPPQPPDRHTKQETIPPGPRPATYAVTMAARYVLDGDRIIGEDVWPPGAPRNHGAPWECAAPR